MKIKNQKSKVKSQNYGFTPTPVKHKALLNCRQRRPVLDMVWGFSLLEIIIAVFVVIVGLLGTYGVFSRMISQTSSISSRLTAIYLAQEGIELVRNIRDGNWIEGENWDSGLADGLAIGESKDYIIDYDDPGLSDFEDKFLNLDANGFYSYNPSAGTTKFKRKITITKIGVDELKVSVMVDHPDTSVVVQEHLYNWK